MTVLFRCVSEAFADEGQCRDQSTRLFTRRDVRIFVAEIARTGRVPVNLKTSENDNLVDIQRRNKSERTR